jgi:hypothetical protein
MNILDLAILLLNIYLVNLIYLNLTFDKKNDSSSIFSIYRLIFILYAFCYMVSYAYLYFMA